MKTLFLPILMIFIYLAQAQNINESGTTIDAQFKDLIEKSSNFQEYKVVKKVEFDRLRKSTSDTINASKSKIESLKVTISLQEGKINLLENELNTLNESLLKVQEEKDTINLLGIPTNKILYNVILWGLIGLLMFLFVFMALKFKNSNRITREAKKELITVEEELEEMQRKSIEKLQKLGRQLQDERNKLAKIKREKP